MAVANTFTFGGVSTVSYGLTVEGSGDYSAPKRAVETIEIPGRNGAFQLDKGYFENIEVEYSIVIADATQADFRDGVDAFCNAIVSLIGYQRLEDTYHPGEYRMAMYAGGLDEDPAFHGKGAIFKVKFDCKPQRYLTSGETAISVTSGDTVTNPTRFEASPLLEVEGYGTINVGDADIEINNETVGLVELLPAVTDYAQNDIRTISNSLANLVDNGDTMTLSSFSVTVTLNPNSTSRYKKLEITSVSFTGSHGIQNYVSTEAMTSVTDYKPRRKFNYGEQTIVKSTGITTYIDTIRFYVRATKSDDTTVTGYVEADLHVKCYSGSTMNYLNIGFGKATISGIPSSLFSSVIIGDTLTASAFTAISSQSVLGTPTYVDCDLGECYKIVDGSITSLNGYIDLGSELPTLAVGDTEITYDNTITDLKVVPRWWKV